MNIIKEFKEFTLRGTVIEMAVGIIIGAAFGKIVTSLVNDIIMPPLGMLVGGIDFKDLKIVLHEAVGNNPAVSVNYGNFIQVTFDFLIVAFCVFMLIKIMNTAMRNKEAAPKEPPAPTEEQKLLAEIRDLLKKKKGIGI